MKKGLFFIVIVLMSGSLSAQILDGIEKRNRQRNSKNPFSSGDRGAAIYSHSRSHFRPFGWHVTPGLTYMAGNTNADKDRTFNLTPSGTPGYYLEIGLAHIFKQKKKVFHYFDYGIGIKHFGGAEKYTDESNNKVKGNFNFGAAFARIDIHSVIQLSKWNFIDQSIGFNFDYTVYGGKQENYGSPLAQEYQEKMLAQLHFSIGWGIKPRDGFFIIPYAKTPFLTGYNWRNFNPGHRWFSSKYQPLIFGVKIGWLFVKRGCPKVYDNGEGQNQSDGYQNR
ncbi:MAG: hypothetical protein ACWA41_03685 [Putridiphycobacter sp.]